MASASSVPHAVKCSALRSARSTYVIANPAISVTVIAYRAHTGDVPVRLQ